MTDQRIELALRATLSAHATTVTRGPDWDGDAGEDVVIEPRRRNRTRRWAPLAAAAVVLAVIGTTLTLRSEPSGPALHTGHQEPIPAGMKAVDALGVEIFVPKAFVLDDSCHGGSYVLRPVPSRSGCGRPASTARYAAISPPTAPPSDAAISCEHPLLLDGERACPVGSTATGSAGTGPVPFSTSITWPRHEVQVTVANLDARTTERILRSAHAVAVDRNGCAARDDTLDVVPKPAPGTFNAELLPRSTQRLSVCWYIRNRLVASALLDKGKAHQVIGVANGMAPKWPAPTPRPDLPSCGAIAKTNGVVLIAHATSKPGVAAVTRFAACNGQRVSTSPTADFLTSPDLATAIAKATGIPLELGYLPGN